MKKNISKWIRRISIIMVIPYLLMAFVVQEYNASEWHWGLRLVLIILIVTVFMWVAVEEVKKKDVKDAEEEAETS